MNIITPPCAHRPKKMGSHHDELFAQGAGVIACEGDLCAGLWFENTPVYQGKTIGTIGGCQISPTPEAATFLSDCASYLHNEHGCQTVVGPMNGNTWLQHRLVIESQGRDPFLMEPMEPTYFYDVFEKAGFSILSRYSSSTIDLSSEQKSYHLLEKRLQKQNIQLRSISSSHFEQDLMAIFKLSLMSFSNNFLYTPLPEKAFIQKYLSSREHIDPELVILAEREDQLVGYVFCMPDLIAHELGKPPAIIIKTLAALPDRSLSGLGTVLVAEAQKIAQAKGYKEAIHALQYESNSSLRISQRFNATIFRRYALMAKSLS